MYFPNNCMKAVTFSYDDGVIQDKRLADIFNKHGIKCTFNINTNPEAYDHTWYQGDELTYRMALDECKKVYKGHEVAVHSHTHPHLETMEREQIHFELAENKRIIEQTFQAEVTGMAYPFGTYNDLVVDVAKENGIRYSRTVKSTHSFELQHDLLRFHPTCHHKDEALFDLAERFIALKPERPLLFYIWGHSYEFAQQNNWDLIEAFCERISRQDDIFYGTNEQVFAPQYQS